MSTLWALRELLILRPVTGLFRLIHWPTGGSLLLTGNNKQCSAQALILCIGILDMVQEGTKKIFLRFIHTMVIFIWKIRIYIGLGSPMLWGRPLLGECLI